jgi:hypothetical protein
MSDVPTSTPMPIVDMSRSCDCDSVRESGNMPARKEATAMTTLRLSRVNSPAILQLVWAVCDDSGYLNASERAIIRRIVDAANRDSPFCYIEVAVKVQVHPFPSRGSLAIGREAES